MAEAISAGDVEAQVNINKDLARLAVEAGELNKAKVTREEQAKLVEQQPQNQQGQQAPKPVHPKAQAWAEKNTWFGSDEPMTLTAFSIHNELIKAIRYMNNLLSDEYYTDIDQRIRDAFPHKFGGTNLKLPL